MLVGLTLSTLLGLTAFSTMFAGAAQSGIDDYDNEPEDYRSSRRSATSSSRSSGSGYTPAPVDCCPTAGGCQTNSTLWLMPRSRVWPVPLAQIGQAGGKLHVAYMAAVFGTFDL